MKRHISVLLALVPLMAMAYEAPSTTSYDATLITQTELNGTPKFMALGGAMGAVGGDATSMFYNPAGIGVYRSSELGLSLNIHWDNATLNGCGPERYTTANLQNFAYVGSFGIGASKGQEKGLLYLNLGLAYSRTKNFSRDGSFSINKNHSTTQFLAKDANGIDSDELYVDNLYNGVNHRSIMSYETYMIDNNGFKDKYISDYEMTGGGNVNGHVDFSERGSSNEFALSLAGNISDMVYCGMSFICDHTTYEKFETRSEVYGDHKMQYESKYNANATGFTYKVGVIVRPTDWLRIGGAYHTPTVYGVKSSNWGRYTSFVNKKESYVQPADEYEKFNLSAPMKAIGSLGFVFGKWGFLDVEYQWTDVNGTKIKDRHNHKVTGMNDVIASDMQDTHTIRAGIEIRPLSFFSLRAGGGYTTSPTKDGASRLYYNNDTRTDISFLNEKESYNVTAGLGIKTGRHAIDLSYVWQVNKGEYFEYQFDNAIAPVSVRNVRNQILLSYTCRF